MCKQLKHVTKAILLLVLFISCQIGASTNLILSPAVAPNPFSPNQDGIKDKLYISFQCAKPWSMWQINILNNTNGSVASMAGMISNTGLSIETNWDGTDQDGILQPDGHYKYTIDLQSDIEAPITSLSISGPSYQTSDHTVYASSNTVFQLTSSDLGTPTSGISEIFYSFDAIGFFSSYQNAFSFKENGDKTLFFFAVDKAGNIGTTNHKDFIFDNLPPNIPQGLAASVQRSNIILNWNSVTNSDLAGYYVYRNGIKQNDALVAGTTFTDQSPLTGSQVYSVSAVDKLGNESVQSPGLIVQFNGAVVITSPESGKYYCDLLMIKGSVINPYADLVLVEVGEGTAPVQWKTLHSIKKGRFKRDPIRTVYSIWNTVHLNGDYTIRISARTPSGWIRDSVIVHIDNTAPVTRLSCDSSPQPPSLKKEGGEKGNYLLPIGASIELIGIDPVVKNVSSGVDKIYYRLTRTHGENHHGESYWDEEWNGNGYHVWNGQPIILSQPGEYRISYASKDKAINMMVPFHSGNLEYQKTKTICVRGYPSHPHTNSSATIHVDGVEPGKYYNTSVTPLISIEAGSAVTTTITLNGIPYAIGSEISENRTHLLSIFVRDALDRTVSTNISFIIDKNSPSISVKNVTNGSYYKTSVAPIVNVNDNNLDTAISTIDGASFNNGNIVSVEANHNLNVRAVDKAKNIAIRSVDFTIDRTPPAIAIEGVANSGTYPEATPVIRISDTNLNPGKTSILLNGSAFVSGSTIVSNGEYRLVVHAEDKAFNVTEKQVIFTVLCSVNTNYLLFYASYDHSDNADTAQGNPSATDHGSITTGDKGRLPGEAFSETGRGVSYSSISNFNATNGTVMMWIKPSWNQASEQGNYLFSVKEDDNNALNAYCMNLVVFRDRGTVLQIKSAAQGMKQNAKNDRSTVLRVAENTASYYEFVIDKGIEINRWYKDKTWTHLAWSWNSRTGLVKIILNGKIAGTFTNSPWIPNKATKMWIANRHSDNARASECRIDDVKIFNKILTPTEVNQQAGMPYVSGLIKGSSAYLSKGEGYYTDRDYVLTNIPSQFRGSLFVKTINDDKQVNGNTPYISFKAEEDLDVYVAFDDRVSPKPAWLTSKFTAYPTTGTGQLMLKTTDPGISYLKLYHATFNIGETVMTGGNNGQNQTTSSYILIIKSRNSEEGGDQ